MLITYDPFSLNTIPDGLVEEFVLNNNDDITTSNFLVVLCAKMLVAEGKLKPFSLSIDNRVYLCDDRGGIDNEPNVSYDLYLERLITAKYGV